jgi:hypothetical protein
MSQITQAKVVIKPLKFADACANPNAKPITVYGPTGPVNAVDVDGTLFIENVEAEAAAEALYSKALESASEVAPVAFEVAPAPKPTPEPVAALDSEPSCSVATSSAILYSAAASKPPVMPKPSAATFQMRSAASSKFSAGLKRSAQASHPAVVLAPLEVNMRMHISVMQCTLIAVHINTPLLIAVRTQFATKCVLCRPGG